MKVTELNPYRTYKSKNYENPIEDIKKFIGENGLVPFEHGYKRPRFKFEGQEYECYMVSDSLVYCFKIILKTEKRRYSLLLATLPKKQLNKIMNELEKYQLYCMYEA